MGNKFCKKRAEQDNAAGSKTPKAFHKIINKLNLKPKWKSDSNLEDKQINSTPISTIQVESKPLSRSTDWIDCALEAPSSPEPRKDSSESKKSIFNDDTTPTPPPRQMKLVRRSILDTVKDAFRTSTASYNNNIDEPEIEEQIMVKKTINYNCPCGGEHTRAQHEKHAKQTASNAQKRSRSILVTSSNHSLPTYNDARMSLPIRPNDPDAYNSALSLPDEHVKKPPHRRSITTDLDSYLVRAKSIGSLIPNVLTRLSTNKAPLAEIESDDSLNSINSMENMEDWNGLNMLEHYEPKESSLPRPSRRTEADLVADLEGMMISDVDAEQIENEAKRPPKPPARKSETLLKKMHKEVRSSNCTPPSTPEEQNKPRISTIEQNYTEKDHSPLMKILNNFGPEQMEAKMNDSNRRSNLSPVHTYIGGAGEKKQKINDFLDSERDNDELYKERIAT